MSRIFTPHQILMYRNFVAKPERKGSLGRYTLKGEDNIKMYLKGTGGGGVP
jgi:hypothetical protein